MPDTCLQLSSAVHNQAKLVAQMSLVADRFLTELLLMTPDETLIVLKSVEGTSSEIWPASGPLQEVVPQSNQDGDFLAGVGAAGKSLWSTIVTSAPDRAGLEFDFACRMKTNPDWLGSTYDLLGKTASIVKIANRIEVPLGKWRISCQPLDSSSIDLSEEIRIAATPSSDDSPRTDRWKYRFELI